MDIITSTPGHCHHSTLLGFISLPGATWWSSVSIFRAENKDKPIYPFIFLLIKELLLFSKVNGSNQWANENISLFQKFVELLSGFSAVFSSGVGGCPRLNIQDLQLDLLIWILGHYCKFDPFPSFPFDECGLTQANPVSTVAPEKLPQTLQTQFCWINWTKEDELAPPTIWVTDHFLFLLLPKENSHTDLLSLGFATSKVGDSSPSKEVTLHFLENCSSCLSLRYFGLWILSGQKSVSLGEQF